MTLLSFVPVTYNACNKVNITDNSFYFLNGIVLFSLALSLSLSLFSLSLSLSQAFEEAQALVVS